MSLILVIEDQEDACGLIRRLLMRLGHTVVCVETTSEADKWLEDHVVDLVIMGAGRLGELAKERLDILRRHGVDGSRILLGVRRDAKDLVKQRFGKEVREVFDSPQGVDELEAMVRRALQMRKSAL